MHIGRALLFAASLLAVSATDGWSEEACNNPDALGVSRVQEVDTSTGPIFGDIQYTHAPTFLKDKEVVLTFDDGPFPSTTPEILSALAEQCTKATFFYVGKMALDYPNVLAEVDRAGHTLATHTWGHANLHKLTAGRAVAEIEKGISILSTRLGHPIAPFFRFPYLSDPKTDIKYLGTRNFAVFSADVDSWDSHGLTPSAHIVNYVMSRLKAQGHGIVLMHDIKHTTANALPEILRQLKAEGYKIVHMVPKAAAVSLPIYDQWAMKMIRAHDAGVAVASNSDPVDPADANNAADTGMEIATQPRASNRRPQRARALIVAVRAESALVRTSLKQNADARRTALIATPIPAVVAELEQTPDEPAAPTAKANESPLQDLGTAMASSGEHVDAAAERPVRTAALVVAANEEGALAHAGLRKAAAARAMQVGQVVLPPDSAQPTLVEKLASILPATSAGARADHPTAMPDVTKAMGASSVGANGLNLHVPERIDIDSAPITSQAEQSAGLARVATAATTTTTALPLRVVPQSVPTATLERAPQLVHSQVLAANVAATGRTAVYSSEATATLDPMSTRSAATGVTSAVGDVASQRLAQSLRPGQSVAAPIVVAALDPPPATTAIVPNEKAADELPVAKAIAQAVPARTANPVPKIEPVPTVAALVPPKQDHVILRPAVSRKVPPLVSASLTPPPDKNISAVSAAVAKPSQSAAVGSAEPAPKKRAKVLSPLKVAPVWVVAKASPAATPAIFTSKK